MVRDSVRVFASMSTYYGPPFIRLSQENCFLPYYFSLLIFNRYVL